MDVKLGKASRSNAEKKVHFHKCELIAAHSQLLFCWKQTYCRLYVTRISEGRITGTDADYPRHARILFGNVPVRSVLQMEIDPACCCLALVSETEISVVYLPSSSPGSFFSNLSLNKGACKSMFMETGDESDLSPTKYLLVRWYPDSSKGSFLFALCDDSTLKVYKSTFAFPLNVINLNLSLFRHSYSKLDHSDVANRFIKKFAFGLPLAYCTQKSVSYYWPVFLVTASCRLFCIFVNVHERKFIRSGYLKLSPRREDNYETNVLDFACMTNFGINILLILGSSGQIYHCLALQHKPSSELLIKPDDAFHVYAYEVLDVSKILGRYPVASKAGIVLYLLEDPHDPLRYFISHRKGVHEIRLPWVSEFLLASSRTGYADEICFSCSSAIPIFQSVQTASSGKPPVLSLACIPHPLGPSRLILLLKDKGLLILQLPKRHQLIRFDKEDLDLLDISTSWDDGYSQIAIKLLQEQTPFPHISISPKQAGTKECFLLLKDRVKHLRKELNALEKGFNILNAKMLQLTVCACRQVQRIERVSESFVSLEDGCADLRDKVSEVKFNTERINEWLELLFRCACKVHGIEMNKAERSHLAKIEYYEQCAADLGNRIKASEAALALFYPITTGGKVNGETIQSVMKRLKKIDDRLTPLVKRLSN
ncbi:Nuclear pore complex protein Nup88 [Trichuris trichiura]|uniref:Nuclear pore complex protein Nup88 n=1 Tax=Trichuris trichiura TaxID=36087 RepID=A0A077ZBV8_TRITR|nr:Nuclear pore complex protein Nup88 [Trichuris trichiura]